MRNAAVGSCVDMRGNVSAITSWAKNLESDVKPPMTPMAQVIPNRSGNTSESLAPMAYPLSRQSR